MINQSNNQLKFEYDSSLKRLIFVGMTFIIIGSMENYGKIYLELFYGDYLKEYFPKELVEEDLIFHYTKRVYNYKLLKLGISEWKNN